MRVWEIVLRWIHRSMPFNGSRASAHEGFENISHDRQINVPASPK